MFDLIMRINHNCLNVVAIYNYADRVLAPIHIYILSKMGKFVNFILTLKAIYASQDKFFLLSSGSPASIAAACTQAAIMPVELANVPSQSKINKS